MTDLTVAETASIAKELYAGMPRGTFYKQALRPYIAPFHIIVELVPPGSSLLDVGCGAGLFVALLARLGRIRSAVGFDTNGPAIDVARSVAGRLPPSVAIQFERQTAVENWPSGRFDVVSIVDVVHHIPPSAQAGVIAKAAEHVREGGLLLYKDMARRPLWRAWANRLHDLLSAGEWINYAPIEDVIGWATDAGFRVEERGATNMLWYRHEWCVFRR